MFAAPFGSHTVVRYGHSSVGATKGLSILTGLTLLQVKHDEPRAQPSIASLSMPSPLLPDSRKCAGVWGWRRATS
jgi:hypothetical protein